MTGVLRTIALSALTVLAALTPPMAAAQQLRALVIGIDDYADRPLKGAVADARDLADALTGFGATEIASLIDGAATRDAVIREWSRLVSASRRGDTLVLTYAGHGGQTPELIPGDEADGRDEVLLLSGGPDQGLLDNEVYGMLADAAERGVKVLAIFDTCHSGTPWRSVGPAALRNHSDLSTPTLSRSARDRLESRGRGADMLSPPPGVLVIGASQDQQVVPEFPIHGAPRGALSYTVARLLRETGDTVDFGAFVTQVRRGVRAIADRHHVPSFAPRDLSPDAVVLTRPGTAPAVMPTATSTEPPLALAFVGATANQQAAALAHPGVTSAASPVGADLVLDFACGAVRTPELIHSPGLTAATAGRFIDRWRLVRALQARRGAGVEFSLTTDAPVVPFGEFVRFASEPPENAALTYLTMFAIAGDGSVFGLYPLAGRDALEPSGQRIPDFDLMARPPAGQDHVFVIWSDGPMERSLAVLDRASGSADVGPLRQALLADLDDHAAVIGYASVVTGELFSCQ